MSVRLWMGPLAVAVCSLAGVIACGADDASLDTDDRDLDSQGKQDDTGVDTSGRGDGGDANAPPPDAGPEPVSCEPQLGVVQGTGETLRVRAAPSTSAEVRMMMREGSQLPVVCVAQGEAVSGDPNWYFLGAARGYVAAAFVALDAAAAVPACTPQLLACGQPLSPEEVPEGPTPQLVIEGPGVREHVQRLANDLCAVLGACTISTYNGHDPSPDLALDILTSELYGQLPNDDYAFGDSIAEFLLRHQAFYRIDYVIFRQRINSGDGWSGMNDRGSITQNHYDHVHVSFEP